MEGSFFTVAVIIAVKLEFREHFFFMRYHVDSTSIIVVVRVVLVLVGHLYWERLGGAALSAALADHVSSVVNAHHPRADKETATREHQQRRRHHEEHQEHVLGLMRVEPSHHELGSVGCVVAGEARRRGAVSPIPTQIAIEVGAFVREGVDASLEIDEQSGGIVEDGEIAFVRQKGVGARMQPVFRAVSARGAVDGSEVGVRARQQVLGNQ